MRVYHPQIKITLIKSQRRDEIADGISAIQERYQKLDYIDLTPYLSDSSTVQVTKSTRQPSGAWSISFADQPHRELLETIYALIEPQDLIEIRFAHDSKSMTGGKLQLVMRGFVSRISRQEAMGGNNPQRFVNVSGHDFMKTLQIYRLNYRVFTELSKYALTEFKFFQAFAGDAEVKNMSGSDFAKLVVDKLVNPYMADISALTKADEFGAKAINQWTVESSIEGHVSALAVNGFTDASLYEIFRTVLDIGAFNELYLEDREDAPVLVLRPVPFKNADGDFIQGSADSLDISSVDIINQQVTRSDDSVANYFWVNNNRMALMTNQNQQAAALQGGTDSFVKFDYLNCKKSVFGIRMLDVETVMGDSAQTDSNALKLDNLNKESKALLSWVERRRKLLADMNQDNVVFETGSIRLRGNEAIKAGMYLNIYRGDGESYVGEVYAHTVTHSFAPFQGFFTDVQFERGTLFIDRAQFPKSPYIPEIENQGVK